MTMHACGKGGVVMTSAARAYRALSNVVGKALVPGRCRIALIVLGYLISIISIAVITHSSADPGYGLIYGAVGFP
jgi:hypothetical protein